MAIVGLKERRPQSEPHLDPVRETSESDGCQRTPVLDCGVLSVDTMFPFCSNAAMTRIDEDTLSHHIEVALAGAAPSLLEGLGDVDRQKRYGAISSIARHLAERMRGFDIMSGDIAFTASHHPSLFPDDLGPISQVARR